MKNKKNWQPFNLLHINKTIVTDDRQIAMKWWNELAPDDKERYTQLFFKGRSHNTLTGREIQMINNSVCAG